MINNVLVVQVDIVVLLVPLVQDESQLVQGVQGVQET